MHQKQHKENTEQLEIPLVPQSLPCSRELEVVHFLLEVVSQIQNHKS